MMITNKLKKKAQHEIVGFILIVVIVVLIGLFLLVLYLRKTPVETSSLDLQNFLQASMSYTTDCIISIEPLNMQDTIKSCYKNQQCSNGKMACEMLNKTLAELVYDSLMISSLKPINAYSLLVYYEEDNSKDKILELKEGSCSGAKTGAEHLIAYSPGNIVADMEICYAANSN